MLCRVDEALALSLEKVIKRSAAHLTRFGDYEDLVAFSRDELVTHYLEADIFEAALVLEEKVHGVASLIRYRDDAFGLGYWLAADSTGRGFATAAAAALCGVARGLGATEVWAGIRSTNSASIKVVERLGFVLARRQQTHLSYCLSIEVP